MQVSSKFYESFETSEHSNGSGGSSTEKSEIICRRKSRSLAHATELDSMSSSSSCVNSLGQGLLNSPTTVLYLSRSFQ
ncbi:hypothetical protein NC653_019680 [Populus alba x Populus x berolinensis]|uniref:Uncharacterized protein n=1 Tax=Populus alba x Populus x berolinensis TaxID=444605 RepID=A0AAD6QJJ6_9ROSI|nr:hypothetical protein NC653_019680 [Populus alba x Populus x berolinensis]